MRSLTAILATLLVPLAAVSAMAIAVWAAYATRHVWPVLVATAVVGGTLAIAPGLGTSRTRRGRPLPADPGLRRVELVEHPYRG